MLGGRKGTIVVCQGAVATCREAQGDLGERGKSITDPQFLQRVARRSSKLFPARMSEDGIVEDEHTHASATFASLGLDDWLVQALSAMSIRRPTPIQASCILPILEGILSLTLND